jgi:hypothetical protein
MIVKCLGTVTTGDFNNWFFDSFFKEGDIINYEIKNVF